MADILSGASSDAANATSELDESQLSLQQGEPPIPPDRLDTADGIEDYPPPNNIRITKKLVLFSDGTGNSAAKAQKTNVWRMFQALDLSTSDQMALYDDGVGTETNKYLAAIGGAFGYGLKRNVIDLYKFVCRNYLDDTTEIYGFGFSRGAFTIRLLIGLIAREGLVTFTSEEDLHARAEAAYAHFRRRCFTPPPLSPVRFYRGVRKLLVSVFRRSTREAVYRTQQRRPVARIKFLGLWDTVSAYGMPIAELKPAINWLFWPMNFNDLKLSPKVERACHALSLDDERTTFHPIVWDETTETDRRRITQVWFAGVHANVGGGYPQDQLSLVSLDWMMAQALNNGLRLQASCVERTSLEKTSYARIYDARAGKGMFYRYSPREIKIPIDKSSKPVLPIVHGSVIARMARGGDGYVPNPLPPKFLVLAPDGQLLPMDGFPDPITAELINAAAPATPQITNTAIADVRTEQLKEAIDELNQPDEDAIDLIRNTVWWRRVLYLGSSLVAGLIALYPWFATSLHGSLETFSRQMDDTWAAAVPIICKGFVSFDKEFSGSVKGLIGIFEGDVPRIFKPWFGAIYKFPAEFAVIALLFLFTLHTSETLRLRLRDFGNLAWHRRMRAPFRDALLASERKTMRRRLFLLLAFDVTFLASSLIFGEGSYHPLKPLSLAAGIVNVIVLARIAWHWHFIEVLRERDRPIGPGLATQNFARAIRHSRVMRVLNRAIGDYFIPALFGVALVALMLGLVNRLAFDVASATGAFCNSSIASGDKSRLVALTTAKADFRTDQLCWSSGLRLERQTRYRIIVDASQAGWKDDTVPTDPYGFKLAGPAHLLGTPLKRWVTEPWFAPIVHIGKKGNEEYALTPCVVRRVNGNEKVNRNVLISEFTTQDDGELFMFVNDAVLGIPGLAGAFYTNNHGTATVAVEQIREGASSPYDYYCPK